MTIVPNPGDLTALVNLGPPGRGAAAAFWAQHYGQLREIAERMFAREGNHTLQPTALLHEAYARMIDRARVTEEGTRFFLACFATECRRILTDHAKARNAQKRGGRARRHSYSVVEPQLGVEEVPILDLNEAIESLARVSERAAKIVDLRVFAQMNVQECALALGCSASSVDRDWRFAKSWLRSELVGEKDA
ncbi:MAG: sigma-70 family RNA polymerase sigma factor [Planctomycetes bacterium]|nr:sigma-70 family RNA polymerase sigma factor [Planctomycetota bacterium]